MSTYSETQRIDIINTAEYNNMITLLIACYNVLMKTMYTPPNYIPTYINYVDIYLII